VKRNLIKDIVESQITDVKNQIAMIMMPTEYTDKIKKT
jgi:hypothetical protein